MNVRPRCQDENEKNVYQMNLNGEVIEKVETLELLGVIKIQN